ncbi:MAG: redox-sensing transcriptional repressor Rex [Spirochaetia bacterium]
MLNKTTILRLARYLRVLEKLKTLGFIKVFSNNLGDAIGVTPAVVRKDFSMIQIPGNKRGGYNIEVLIAHLKKVLGKDKEQKVILVGCGKIGTALMQYKEFRKEGINIIAGFDSDRERVAEEESVPVYFIDDLPGYVKEHDIKIGIIAVPDTAATQVFDLMTESGIRGILNFSPVELKSTGKYAAEDGTKCVIHNVNIGLEIENLFYLVNMTENHMLSETPDHSIQ